jgi:general secretion pathway protein K
MCGHSAKSNASKDGFILVSVIWITGLLAVIASAFTIGIRSHTLAARNVIQGERAQAIADGMAMFSALKLALRDQPETSQVAGIASACQWAASGHVTVAIQDQGGLVDLNTASPSLLTAFFTGLGLEAAAARATIDDLTDFKDSDKSAQSGGEEPLSFPDKSFGFKDAPLSVPEEIDQLPRFPPEQFARLMRLTTTYSQQPGIDFEVAPQELLEALNISGKVSDDASLFASPSPRRTYSITAAAETLDGSRFVRKAVVFLLQQPDRPFAVLSWQRGEWRDDVAKSVGAPPCFN